MEKAHKQTGHKLDMADGDPLTRKTTYTVNGRRFVVTAVFRDGGESFSSILLRMMKADVTIQP